MLRLRTPLIVLFFHLLSAAGEQAVPRKPSQDHLRVVTWNVKKGTPATQTVKAVQPYDADILLLQEVDVGTARSDSEDQPEILKRELKMHVYYAASYEEHPGTTGQAILSKLPLVETETITLQNSRNVGAFATVIWRGQKLALISTHFSSTYKANLEHARSSAASRIREAERILGLIDDKRLPVILGGDLNCAPSAPPYEMLKKGLKPLTAGPTFPSSVPVLALDHFFVHSSLATEKPFIGRPGSSDHLPVVVDIAPATTEKKAVP
jgi:endonuclease/exonuclease/phosphatase family metal-dependent hydrolase